MLFAVLSENAAATATEYLEVRTANLLLRFGQAYSYSISRENAVGTVTTLRAEPYRVRIPLKATDSSVPQNVQTVSEPHPPCYSVGTEVHTRG